MRKKVNILAIIIVIVILTGWYFNLVSLYYIIPIAILYLIINIIGSANIQLNYFVYSQCNATTSKKEIAITFDDGPHPDITPKLIELLKKHNIEAAFFCVGKNADANPEIVANIFTGGHIIGNHSYSHSKLFDLFSSKKMQQKFLID